MAQTFVIRTDRSGEQIVFAGIIADRHGTKRAVVLPLNDERFALTNCVSFENAPRVMVIQPYEIRNEETFVEQLLREKQRLADLHCDCI